MANLLQHKGGFKENSEKEIYQHIANVSNPPSNVHYVDAHVIITSLLCSIPLCNYSRCSNPISSSLSDSPRSGDQFRTGIFVCARVGCTGNSSEDVFGGGTQEMSVSACETMNEKVSKVLNDISIRTLQLVLGPLSEESLQKALSLKAREWRNRTPVHFAAATGQPCQLDALQKFSK